jgi:hypothetical protein
VVITVPLNSSRKSRSCSAPRFSLSLTTAISLEA